MIARRIAYFFINAIVAMAIVAVIEIFVAFWSLAVHPETLVEECRMGGGRFFFIFPLLMGLFDSRTFGCGFLGAYFAGVRVVTPRKAGLSMLGSLLRSGLFYFPPLLISGLYPWGKYSDNYSLDVLMKSGGLYYDVVAVFVFSLIPISIAVGRGVRGIHDCVLSICLLPRASDGNGCVCDKAASGFVSSLVVCAIVSICSVGLVRGTDAYKQWHHLANVAAGAMGPVVFRDSDPEQLLLLDEGGKIAKELEADYGQIPWLRDHVVGVTARVENNYVKERSRSEQRAVFTVYVDYGGIDETMWPFIVSSATEFFSKHYQETSLRNFVVEISRRWCNNLLDFHEILELDYEITSSEMHVKGIAKVWRGNSWMRVRLGSFYARMGGG